MRERRRYDDRADSAERGEFAVWHERAAERRKALIGADELDRLAAARPARLCVRFE